MKKELLPTPKNGAQDLRDAVVNSLIRNTEAGRPIVVLVSDSTSTSKLKPFMDRFPHRVVNVGIAEQNLVSMAAGMALGGFTAVTSNAAPFLLARANEQIKNDVCYSETNVKLLGINAGVAYGPLGSTHHVIDDISIMRGLGNIEIFAPCDGPEAGSIMDYVLAHSKPAYIRLDNAALPVLHDRDYCFEPGRLDILLDGGDVTLFALGSVVHEAYEAARRLARRGVRLLLANASSIRPCNRASILAAAVRTGRAITVEEHGINGGLGSLVADILAEAGVGIKLTRLGIADGEFAKAGPRAGIRRHHRIDADGIEEAVLDALPGCCGS